MKKRAVIYARYSSDLQDEASNTHQVAEARRAAEREGYTVVGVYTDAERPGWTTVDRDGYARLIEDARARKFDRVIVESMDRLARDKLDSQTIFQHFKWYGAHIWTPAEGEITELHIDIKGIISSQSSKDTAVRVRRTFRQKVESGHIPGPPAYGYRTVSAGRKEIDPEQAKVMQRLFTEYATGKGPRAITADLNAEGIVGPGGRPWRAHYLTMPLGIFFNRLYVGEYEWGRRVSVKNFVTQRKNKVKASGLDYIKVAHPELRIISDELFEAVHAVRLARGNRASRPAGDRLKARSETLLSGLLRCDDCGANMILGAGGGVGLQARVRCSNAHHERGICSHSKSYRIGPLQHGVITALKDALSNPGYLKEYLTTYHKERDAVRRRASAALAADTKKLAAVEAKIMRLVGLYASGDTALPLDVIKRQLAELEEERAELKGNVELAKAETKVVSLHPAALKRFQEAIDTLHDELTKGGEYTKAGRLALQSLIDYVAVIPTAARKPYEFTLHGRLSALTGAEVFPRRAFDEMVAEQGVAVGSDIGCSPGTRAARYINRPTLFLGRHQASAQTMALTA